MILARQGSETLKGGAGLALITPRGFAPANAERDLVISSLVFLSSSWLEGTVLDRNSTAREFLLAALVCILDSFSAIVAANWCSEIVAMA
jgi:hypothetical protein